MKANRRVFLGVSALAAALATTSSRSSAAPTSPKPFPLESELQAGDLLWPKVPGVFVPYRYTGGLTPSEDMKLWETEKAAKLAAMQKNLNMDNVQEFNTLKNITYEQFRARYLQGDEPGKITPYSFGNIAAVGHVAIVTRQADGRAGIVEAFPPRVVTSTYAKWVEDHVGQIVWQGRMKGRSTADGQAVAAEALKFNGRPYDFWDFNLADDSGFYCSKLVWLATMRSLGTAVDGNPDPGRHFWLSPKQVLYSDKISILLDQGSYATE